MSSLTQVLSVPLEKKTLSKSTPIPINSGVPKPYTINLGPVGSIIAYLQSFNLSINPPGPSTVSYSFVFTT